MKHSTARAKIEYGDFQTPFELAKRICRKLRELGVAPAIVVEPTCGQGAFVRAAAQSFPLAQAIIGCELNATHLSTLRAAAATDPALAKLQLEQLDFFATDWRRKLLPLPAPILLLGNLPWVTNAVQGALGSNNLPLKQNLHGLNGLDALTGKSNFDISEWMLMRLIEALHGCQAQLAFICKTSVARKLLAWLHRTQQPVEQAALFKIDATSYFEVTVDACLLFLCLGGGKTLQTCKVFADLDDEAGLSTGWRHNILIKDLETFDQHKELFGKGPYQWRSGIKHDCAEVMELRRLKGKLVNGFGEKVELETDFLYPLLKGADIANGRVSVTDRLLLVTQQTVGADTRGLKLFAPKTWAYLEAHAEAFARRKSRIYRGGAPYSIFGVGRYAFAPWKMAICGLYKKLDFQRIGLIEDRPVVFDDTVYFLSFDQEAECRAVQEFLNARATRQFLDSMIFWDEKRPVKSAVLNHLKICSPNFEGDSLFPL